MGALQNQSPEALTPPQPSALEHQQRRRMITALLVLTLALILVLIKDWRLMSPPAPSAAAASETTEPEPPQPTAFSSGAALPAAKTIPFGPQLAPPEEPVHVKKASPPQEVAKAVVPPMVVTTSRAVLPPLEVEVVAGNQRHEVDPKTNSVNVKMQDGVAPLPAATPPPATADAPVATATERVQLSPDAVEVLDRPVEPTYPLLAKQMKVQGAVVLQALIDKTGDIQEIQVLSGPAILSAAAREAVRQWRFKPHLQSGRPVDTEARITVNFTISTY
ncbi:MAG TPA: TonB family protein [Terriglobales bacterium]